MVNQQQAGTPPGSTSPAQGTNPDPNDPTNRTLAAADVKNPGNPAGATVRANSAPEVPIETKETFLKKAEEDIEAAYHWLVAEIHKLYAK